MRKSIIGATCACLLVVSTSHAATIDFESATLTFGSGTTIGNPYLEDGFSVSTDYLGVAGFIDGWQSNAGSSNGTITAMVWRKSNDPSWT